jgi:hypothetical protein
MHNFREVYRPSTEDPESDGWPWVVPFFVRLPLASYVRAAPTQAVKR